MQVSSLSSGCEIAQFFVRHAEAHPCNMVTKKTSDGHQCISRVCCCVLYAHPCNMVTKKTSDDHWSYPRRTNVRHTFICSPNEDFGSPNQPFRMCFPTLWQRPLEGLWLMHLACFLLCVVNCCKPILEILLQRKHHHDDHHASRMLVVFFVNHSLQYCHKENLRRSSCISHVVRVL